METIQRNCPVTQRMQQPCWDAPRDLAINIAESIPGVITAVEPHRQLTAGLQKARQILHRGLAVRRVVQNSEAVNVIEAFCRKRQPKRIGLKNDRIAMRQIM